MVIREACVGSYREALQVAAAGADRIELCDNLAQGGTTPGPGTLKMTRSALALPIHVIIRPRGWHLDEKHVLVDGQPIAGGLFDAALFAFHNARALMRRDRGPYFYLPKLQSMEEAALWETALAHIEGMLGLPHGQIKVTVLIETLPAVFEMDEILYALRDRIVGLNCGR